MNKIEMDKIYAEKWGASVIEDGIEKRRIAPKIFTDEAGKKRLHPGISIIQAHALGLSIKDLWRMAENGESILVDDKLLDIDKVTLKRRFSSK